eukprot:Partr_v1_DN28477_c4_g1_i1_m41121 putative protein 1 (negative cofactor 2 alpha)
MAKKWKTKFPMARIKKIMQKDEEIGKLAAAVPVLVSKAVELFLQSLIESCCDETMATASVPIESKGRLICTATHLKRAVEANASYDFLRDMVKDVVPEVMQPAPIAATSAEHDEDTAGLSSPRPPKRRRQTRQASSTSISGIVVTSVAPVAQEIPSTVSASVALDEETTAPTNRPSIMSLMNPVDEDIAISSAQQIIPLGQLNIAAGSPALVASPHPATPAVLQEDDDYDS